MHMHETIIWTRVRKGRALNPPSKGSWVLVRMDNGNIKRTKTRTDDGWLGVDVHFWAGDADRHISYPPSED